MLKFEPVDECVCYLTLKGTFFNITIICAYAPTEDNDDMVKSSCSDGKDTVYQTIPKHDAVSFIRDMNAKVVKTP
jgi:hypothetical protein